MLRYGLAPVWVGCLKQILYAKTTLRARTLRFEIWSAEVWTEPEPARSGLDALGVLANNQLIAPRGSKTCARIPYEAFCVSIMHICATMAHEKVWAI